MYAPLFGIELPAHSHMRRREALHSLGVLHDPNGLGLVRHEHAALRLPSWMAHRRAASPAFLHAVSFAGLHMFRTASLIADPTRPGLHLCRCALSPPTE